MRSTSFSAVLAGVALLAAAAPCVAQTCNPPLTVITGTVLGADGAPMKMAHVHLLNARGSRQVARAQVEPDGRFALATVRTGAFRLELTGVDHYRASLPLILQAPATVVVNVRLQRYVWADSFDSVAAIDDWNRFSFTTPKPLVRQADGRYTLEGEASADTLAYQLVGMDAKALMFHSLNGTLSDRYVYDEGGVTISRSSPRTMATRRSFLIRPSWTAGRARSQ